MGKGVVRRADVVLRGLELLGFVVKEKGRRKDLELVSRFEDL